MRWPWLVYALAAVRVAWHWAAQIDGYRGEVPAETPPGDQP